MPRMGLSNEIFLSSASGLEDPSGSIVYNAGGAFKASYIIGAKPSPKVIRYWMREGAR